MGSAVIEEEGGGEQQASCLVAKQTVEFLASISYNCSIITIM